MSDKMDNYEEEALDCMEEEPTIEKITAVTSFLPYFKNKESKFYKQTDSGLRYYSKVYKFMRTLYDEGFILSIDYSPWMGKVKEYANNPSLLETADITTIQKLLTAIVRSERMFDGMLSYSIKKKLILKMLQRLEKIRLHMQANIGSC